jgi:replication factor C subunit 2/4
MIDPIISRCVKFRFKPIDKDSMIFRLKQIALKENITLTDICFEKIFQISEGDARRSIMLLQNVKYLYKYKKNITIKDLDDLVGSTSVETLDMIWDKIMNDDIAKLVEVTQYIKNHSVNITELLHFLKNKIVRFKSNILKDNIKSKMINIITNTEAKLLERGDEFINILYVLASINIEIKN